MKAKKAKKHVFNIEIMETLTSVVEVEAETEENAIAEVEKKYEEQEYVLTGDDLSETNFRALKE